MLYHEPSKALTEIDWTATEDVHYKFKVIDVCKKIKSASDEMGLLDKFNQNEGPFKALPHCVCNQCGRSLCGQGRLLLMWELYVQTMWNFYVDGHLPKASFS